MISCTEFIPAYSELLKYLDDRYGYDEVQRFWEYLFAPTGKGIPLINFVKKDGLKGAYDYWAGALSEEAADVVRYYNPKQGWIFSEMRYCPSKGRLLKLREELGVDPYPHYCDHCDYYRAALEKAGLCWVRNHKDVDKAACQSLVYDPKVFKGMMQFDEDTIVTEYRSLDLEYFHRDFHSSMNMGIDYLGTHYGSEVVREYLTQYATAVCRREIEAVKKGGLPALEAFILDTYRKEHAEDAVKTKLANGVLTVDVAYCPAVRHLRGTGRDVSAWFADTTSVVMEVIASEAGLQFSMDAYDPATGAASYRFTEK